VGNPSTFAIAITDKPIKLKIPIEFEFRAGNKMHHNILPGRHSTLSKLLNVNELEDLY